MNKEDLSLSPEQIQQLYYLNIIDADGVTFANENHLAPLQWWRWIMRLCLGLGTALLLSGIVFFFAYNWHDMPTWSKLSLIQAAMILCFIGAILVSPKKLLGQCLVLAGSIFIGVFFAVFGQIYQTGADAWQLFSVWALLMLGFVLLSQFPAQWILQWVITGVALFLAMTQNAWWTDDNGSEFYTIATMAIYTLCVWLLQLGLSQKHPWLACSWLRYLTLSIAYFYLVLLFIIALFDRNAFWQLISSIITIGLVAWHYRKKYDLFVQILGVAALAIMLWAFMLYLITRHVPWYNDIIITGIMLLVTIGASVGVYQGALALKRHNEGDMPL